MRMIYNVKVATLPELKRLALQIASQVIDNAISMVLLSGDLGVGKTTLVGYIVKSLGIDNNIISSPTFNIVNEYYSEKHYCKIFHFDLYRLNSVFELYEIGFEEMLSSGISFIEWPHIAQSFFHVTKQIMNISITMFENNVRKIEVTIL